MDSIISESDYLMISNRIKCSELLQKELLSPENIYDFLISLHIVLEVSLNKLFREIVINNLQKTISREKIVDDLDKLTFIDKVIFFILFAKFDFKEKIEDADKYYSIIGKLKDFSNTRNKLLHGSMIGSFTDSYTVTNSVYLLTDEHKSKQIESFKFIFKGLKFYCDCLKDYQYDKARIDKLLDINFLEK